ncbi:MAG: hypothetical protein V7K92_17930 [Nostoc sp.]|uniref:hypothetical protein n=1 Tax=Nostoc sp. TaxID=1180 RepID=UPI002FF15AD1
MIILSQRLSLIFLELLPVRYRSQTKQNSCIKIILSVTLVFFCYIARMTRLFSTAIATLEDI